MEKPSESIQSEYSLLGTIVRLALLIGFLLVEGNVFGQSAFLPLSNAVEGIYDPYINRVDANMHTSVRPFLIGDLKANCNYDSLSTTAPVDTKFGHSLFGRKLLREHLIDVSDEDYGITIDPVFDLSGGQDMDASKSMKMNSRGVMMQGSIGKRFSFHTTFYENQATFAQYMNDYVHKSRVVPGGARVKTFGTNSFDFAWATGVMNYRLDKHFTFQFGHDKNFIGDGYRSLLLSDNAFAYPFFKVITDLGKIRYWNMFAVMQDLQKDVIDDGERFRQKYGSFHYLDINLGKRFTVGVFEAVIWHGDSTGGNRGFDLGYMNPIIFYRPVEFSIGSPDNVLMGFTTKFRINSNNLLYGQLMLDEFVLKEVKSGNGWWGNKQGFQGGFKSFNVLGVKNLHLQGEFNYVRPFTYSHRNPLGNYGHYRAALAHPLGANFYEAVGIAKYSYKRFQLQGKVSYAVVGLDTAGENFGQNIFLSYNDRYQEYNNKVGQGLKTTITWVEGEINYLVNPVSRFSIFLNASLRNVSADGNNSSTLLVMGGIHTRLFNRYSDF